VIEMAKERLTITMSKHILEYVDKRAEELGMNRSATITYLINSTKDTQDVLTVMDKFERSVNKMQKIQNKNNFRKMQNDNK
jgi:metal-responsive CopG/Arc/MetJ family transcriptional regulator